MGESSNLAVIAILATTVGALVWVIKYLFTKVVPALDGLKQSTEANTQATKAADQYLRERNGRDSEHHTESLKAIQAIPPTLQKIADEQAQAIIKAVTVQEQHVEHQYVEKETVNKKG